MKTVRRRSGQAGVGLWASLLRGDRDEQAQAIAEAYVQWESQPLTLANGTRMRSRAQPYRRRPIALVGGFDLRPPATWNAQLRVAPFGYSWLQRIQGALDYAVAP